MCSKFTDLLIHDLKVFEKKIQKWHFYYIRKSGYNSNNVITGMITAAESEFYYRPGKSYNDYSFPDYIPYFRAFTDDQITEAWGVCGESHNEQCIFDYLVTNDSTLAINTFKEFQIYAERLEIASK